MFNKLFNKNKTENKSSEIGKIPLEPQKLAFKLLIFEYLKKYEIDESGNEIISDKVRNEEHEKWIQQTLKVAGFVDNLEEVIIAEWKEKKRLNNTIKPKEFVDTFLSEFHNLKIENVVPEFVKDRNIKLFEAYHYVINTIDKIQGWFDDDILRTKIESDFRKKTGIQSTMFQCTTPFCIISLGCDQLGRYNLVYSVDYRFQEIISENFASTLLRRIYELTSGEIEAFVKIGSLHMDCIETFNKLIEEAKYETYHKITTQSKHNNE